MAALGLGFAALAGYLLWQVNRLAVNVLFRDQWPVYFDIAEGAPWSAFIYQSNVHRLGLGGVGTELLARATGWNAASESWLVAFLLVGAAGLGLWLKARVIGRLTAIDL